MPGWWYFKIQHIILFLKGTGSRLVASFFTMQLEKLLVNEKKPQLHVKLTCLPSIVSNITSHKNELWKTGCSISIFFKFVHQCFFLYLAVLFITSFSFLSSYFYVSFSLNVYEFCETATTFGDNCSLQGWKTINFIQYFGGAVLFGGSLLLLSCGNDWGYVGEEVNISHTANYA